MVTLTVSDIMQEPKDFDPADPATWSDEDWAAAFAMEGDRS